ncbi:hypothetical protein J4463_00945 [Candidatus Pacearchaeota archaeon]|nr:hypothetical protein [Candidatus Pacearchaeota archaeon]
MTKENLLKLFALLISLIGIFSLYSASVLISPKETPLEKISELPGGSKVFILGIVEKISNSSSGIWITIHNQNSSARIFLECKDKICSEKIKEAYGQKVSAQIRIVKDNQGTLLIADKLCLFLFIMQIGYQFIYSLSIKITLKNRYPNSLSAG